MHWRVCLASMAKPKTKTRTLHLADGGLFRIGPGTVSIPVSTLPLDPPAVVLHVNRSCGALELEPTADNVALPPMRLDAARVLELVNQINADRLTAGMRGGKLEPPVELPPTFKSTARHVHEWRQTVFPNMNLANEAVGYPSKQPGVEQTLWVKRATGACVLELVEPPPMNYVRWEEIKPRAAVEWLHANGYRALPATLHRLARLGATDERPRKRPRKR